MADLKTNYVDDVLDASVNTKRKYNMIQNADGTVSFDDVTTYTQNGDSFGAKDVNDTNTAVNELNNNLTAKVSKFTDDTYVGVTGLAYDSTNNKLGLKVEGADTVIPFSSGSMDLIYENKSPSVFEEINITINGLSDYDYLVVKCIHHYTWIDEITYPPFLTWLENKENTNQIVLSRHYLYPSINEIAYRYVKRVGDTLTITGGAGTLCIPVAIYGIKF